MKKKISYLIIFLIISIFFIGIKDVSAEECKAYCDFGDYYIEYNASPIFLSKVYKKGSCDNLVDSYIVNSEFDPTKEGSWCPDSNSYEAVVDDKNKTFAVKLKESISFICPAYHNSYKYDLRFDSDGKLIGVDVNGVSAPYVAYSYFHPKNQSECPPSKDIVINIVSGIELYAYNYNSAYQIQNKYLCIEKGYIWNKENYCNTDNLQYVMCGDAHDIPAQIPSLISMAVNLLKIATPIILIIVSIITLVKAIMSSKEDEIKKGQQSLIRKVIAAIMIFMIISMVQFVVLKVADDKDQTSISACMSCFLNNDCTANKYFKTNVSGEEYCSKVSDKGMSSELCDSFYENDKTSNNNTSTSSEFKCYVGDYIITFSTKNREEGYPISATTKSGEKVTPDFGTDFYPKNSRECPTDSNAIAGIKDGTLWILKKN